MRRLLLHLYRCAFALLLASCSATKYVPEGKYLLDEVKITTDSKDVSPSLLRPYLRQTPNAEWFNLVKMQLYVYSLSGRDSTKWVNKVLRRMGDPPVVYSETEAEKSRQEIAKAVHNMGYMAAVVSKHTERRHKKLRLHYEVAVGTPYVVKSLHYDVPDPVIASILKADSVNSLLHPGMLLDVNALDNERQRIATTLLHNGYYKFNKDYINYTADTVRNTFQVDLTLHLEGFRHSARDSVQQHRQYRIGKIGFVADYDVLQSAALNDVDIRDSVFYNGYPIYFRDKLYLRPRVLTENLRFASGDLYNERRVQQTYSNFGRLSALKYTNIRFFENDSVDNGLLDCYLLLTKSKHKSVTLEVEGTNSAGDLGAAASVAFQHRNLFHGSETFMVKLRGAYEVISGLQAGYSNNNYYEFGVETSNNFPNFLFPFVSSDFRRRIRATTEFGLQYNYQKRPEFLRTMASASWSYKWSRRNVQHTVDLLNIGFLYLPEISPKFREDYINKGQNEILQYNYQDRLIINMGYSYYYNSLGSSIVNNTITPNSYSIRFNFESAGNVMYAFSKLSRMRRNENGEYAILDIPYAQYVKAEFDYARSIRIDARNFLAFHIGLGVAVPYGNARTIPFEKQYFSGGANSVRGWAVRDLGPGVFPGNGNLLDQSGDIKLDASIEYRSKLFWKFQGAVFVDAGNVWTIRDYANQPGGVFKFSEFYKQIAVAYGLGLRLDLGFFILRFDGGMKAINPVYQRKRDHFPIIHPDFGRDFAFHFAVGYPF